MSAPAVRSEPKPDPVDAARKNSHAALRRLVGSYDKLHSAEIDVRRAEHAVRMDDARLNELFVRLDEVEAAQKEIH